MPHRLYKIKEKIRHRLKARHYGGFGIHSPYLYHLVTSVLQEKWPFYSYNRIEAQRKELALGIKNHKNGRLSNRWIASKKRFQLKRGKDASCGQLIFRLIQNAQFENLMEIGATSGLETQYMALANVNAKCICVAESGERLEKIEKNIKQQGIKNIEVKISSDQKTTEKIIQQLGRIDFVLFNQLSDPQSYPVLFRKCMEKKNTDSIFVLLNLHRNPDRTKVWKEIRNNPDVQVTIDLFHLGIVLFKPELEKKNYVIRTK